MSPGASSPTAPKLTLGKRKPLTQFGHLLNHQAGASLRSDNCPNIPECCPNILESVSELIGIRSYALQRLKFKILNDITWEKTNPPPNLACRQFTHSSETLIWAARDEEASHIFNYDLMRHINRGSQMQSVWRLNAPAACEKIFGEHPTQKPIALAARCILAATCEGDLVLDPFLGSGTTAVACLRHRRRFIGVDASGVYAALASERCRAELEQGIIHLEPTVQTTAT